jgi:hypothetical protein
VTMGDDMTPISILTDVREGDCLLVAAA